MSDQGAAERFAALADPVRLATVEVLSRGPASAGELARHASVSPSVMSRHLRTLQVAGLVTDNRDPHDARRRVFTLRDDGLVAARAWMDQVQAQWNEQLAAFRTHVEATDDGRPAAARPPGGDTARLGEPSHRRSGR
ncbi:metalloregulator ArsR/SmtB family transcription factor [Cellulomonas sp.]|uniref:ArsR/SmtB family transcription factor n=1 Tax=Cellulomonas sp. TaxID=40001 RepID=UPI001AFE3225|nr:metalloregulator ArsR/SmtB family transcription factor [Cellulomonas sp.]MBO9555300.1 winged helix-turn-helix transcriptional regulator [Cellulomonas sp.]